MRHPAPNVKGYFVGIKGRAPALARSARMRHMRHPAPNVKGYFVGMKGRPPARRPKGPAVGDGWGRGRKVPAVESLCQ
jgi:hypothetical protein